MPRVSKMAYFRNSFLNLNIEMLGVFMNPNSNMNHNFKIIVIGQLIHLNIGVKIKKNLTLYREVRILQLYLSVSGITITRLKSIEQL